MANLLLLEWRIDFALRGGGGVRSGAGKLLLAVGYIHCNLVKKLNETGSQLTHHTLYAFISMVIKTLAFK